MNKNIRISVVTFFLGALVYAYRNNLIIIRYPWVIRHAAQGIQAHKKKCKIWYEKQGNFTFESQQIIWDDYHIVANASRLISAYLALIDEEGKLDKKIQVQAVTLNPNQTELLISLSHAPFNEEMSTYDKWMMIEGLLQTIRENITTIKSVIFLIQNQPFTDPHLDFSCPWPIEGFLSSHNQRDTHEQHSAQMSPCTIMLEPAGDAKYTGRIINDSFERGLTLQCAQELKKTFETLHKDFRIVLSRFPGEILEPLQNATFANRLKTDLYITISMYKTDAFVPEMNFYYFLYHPTTDFWPKKISQLSFEPYHQAHVRKSLTSKKIAQSLYASFQQLKPFAGNVQHCAGLPVKPLIGIVAPAIVIELGLNHKNAWQALIPALAQQIQNIVPLILPLN